MHYSFSQTALSLQLLTCWSLNEHTFTYHFANSLVNYTRDLNQNPILIDKLKSDLQLTEELKINMRIHVRVC